MKFIKIYSIIHVFSALFLFLLGGAFSQSDFNQMRSKEYKEVFNQRIRKVVLVEDYQSKKCLHGLSQTIVFLTNSKILALTETKKANINIKAEITIQEIEEEDHYTNEKAQRSADLLNQNLQHIDFEKPVCVEILAQFPKTDLKKISDIEYFKLILTQEEPVQVNKSKMIKNVLIDVLFAPIILLGYLFLVIIGFHFTV